MTLSRGYTIHIVSDEEFDSLPYANVKESLGLANAKTRTAYVRDTGVKELDQTTIEHEFDELLMRVSPHEVDGIRYKSGGGLGKILGPIVGAALTPFIGPVFGAAVGGGISGGTGAHSRSVKPEKYGENTFSSFALDALQGGTGAYAGGKLLTGFGGAPTSASLTTPAGYSGSVTVPGVNASVPIGAAKSVAQATTSSGFGKLGDVIGKFSGTTTDNALGNLTNSTETFFPSKTSDVTNALPTGADGSQGAFSRFLSTSGTTPLTQNDVAEGFKNIDSSFEQRRQNVFGQFRGQTPDENSAFSGQLGNLATGNLAEKQTFLDEANLANQRKSFMETNNLNDQQFNDYLALAKSGSDEDITSLFNQDPNEYRDLFKGFF